MGAPADRNRAFARLVLAGGSEVAVACKATHTVNGLGMAVDN